MTTTTMATGGHAALEAAVAARVSAVLSDDGLAFDAALRFKTLGDAHSDGRLPLPWIDIHDVLLPLIPDTDDEAVVAKAVRAKCTSTTDTPTITTALEVSPDGRSIRRKTPPDTASTDALNARTIYVERLPKSSTQESIHNRFVQYGEIDRVVIPSRHASTTQHKSNSAPTCMGYAFVVFRDPACAQRALSELNALWRPLTSQTNVVEFVQDEMRAPSGLRVLFKAEWDSRTHVYARLFHEKTIIMDQTKQDHLDKHNQASFVSGVVAAFDGVHPGTNRKVLKKLFEMVSPVTFVDHETGEAKGYVRFKTAHDALVAESFFKRGTIMQAVSDDLGTLIPPDPRSFQSPIQLRVLRGREEKDYWRIIRKHQQEKRTKTRTQHSDATEPIASLHQQQMPTETPAAETVAKASGDGVAQVKASETKSQTKRPDKPTVGKKKKRGVSGTHIKFSEDDSDDQDDEKVQDESEHDASLPVKESSGNTGTNTAADQPRRRERRRGRKVRDPAVTAQTTDTENDTSAATFDSSKRKRDDSLNMDNDSDNHHRKKSQNLNH